VSRSAWAAVTYPRLFTALMLVDPVIMRYGTPNNYPNTNKPSLMEGAIARRDTWSSRYVPFPLPHGVPIFLSEKRPTRHWPPTPSSLPGTRAPLRRMSGMGSSQCRGAG
jgi:hypothetical protein